MRLHRLDRPHGRASQVVRGLVLLVLVVASSFATAAPALSVYKGPCSDGTQKSGAAHAFVERSSTHNFAGAIGDVIVRDLLPCGSPTGSKYSYPLVLAANLQYTLNGNDAYIVQIGYEECHVAGGCNGVPSDGENHFVYTASDHGGGSLSLFGLSPATGHRNRFKIQLIDQDYWNFCIKDLTTGGNYVCNTTNYTWPGYSSYAWYGTEVQNTNAGMGSKATEDIDMRWMQYLRVDLGAWWVADHNTCKTLPTSPYPSYWHCYITSTADTDGDGYINDDDTLRSHTHDH